MKSCVDLNSEMEEKLKGPTVVCTCGSQGLQDCIPCRTQVRIASVPLAWQLTAVQDLHDMSGSVRSVSLHTLSVSFPLDLFTHCLYTVLPSFLPVLMPSGLA